MTNNEILMKGYSFFEELFDRGKVVDDCRQICYMDFLLYDNQKLNDLDASGDLRFGIIRFVKNNWFSKTSRYYSLYKKKWYEPYPEDYEDD